MAKRRKSGDGRSGDSDPTARGAVSSDGLGGSYADLKLAVARASASEGQRLAFMRSKTRTAMLRTAYRGVTHEERELKIKILSAWIREAAKVAGKREAQLERLDGDPYAASHLKAKWFLMWHYGATLQHSQTCEREVELIEQESWLKASSTISMSRLIQQTCFDKWRQKVRAWKRKVRARSVRAPGIRICVRARSRGLRRCALSHARSRQDGRRARPSSPKASEGVRSGRESLASDQDESDEPLVRVPRGRGLSLLLELQVRDRLARFAHSSMNAWVILCRRLRRRPSPSLTRWTMRKRSIRREWKMNCGSFSYRGSPTREASPA